MDSKIKLIITLVICIHWYSFALVPSTPSSENYAIGTIRDSATIVEIQTLFDAEGTAAFLIKNQQMGISLGDIIRFKDKAILINGKIWQTLQKENILNKVEVTSIEVVTGTASSKAWAQNAKNTQSTTLQQAYSFGGELLKVMEGYFGKVEGQKEFLVRFRDDKMILLAPKSLFSTLQFKKVKSRPRRSTPQFITPPPQAIITDTPLKWQPWAIDLENPSKEITYTIPTPLPDGLQWNSQTHTLTGTIKQEGTWPISIIATNSFKMRDTLQFNLMVYENSAPTFTTSLPDTIYIGSPWKFTIGISDNDNSGNELKINYQSSDDNLYFNKRTHTLFYNPDKNMDNKKVFLELYVFDPHEDTTYLSKSIHVAIPQNPLRTQALTLTPQWDTLITHHHYNWPLNAILHDARKQNIELLSITATDSIITSDSTLTLIPQTDSLFSIRFNFLRGHDTLSLTSTVPVKNNQSPTFISKLHNYIYPENYTRTYQPIVIDSDNDSYTLSFIPINIKESEVVWKDSTLTLLNKSPGSYTVELVATDSYGNTATQRLYWTVLPQPKNWSSFNISAEYTPLLTMHTLQYESAMGRIQIFTPDLMRIYRNEAALIKRWPFLSAGVNLFNPTRTRKGEYAYLDIGLTFRMPHKKVIAGGVYLGQETRIISNNMIHDFSIKALAKQIIFAADTAGVLKDTSELSYKEQYDQKMGEIKKLENLGYGILGEYGEKNNITLTMQWKSTFCIFPSIYIGPTFKTTFSLIGLELIPRAGLVLRNQFHFKYTKLDHVLTYNYGGSANSSSIEYSIQLGIGSWE